MQMFRVGKSVTQTITEGPGGVQYYPVTWETIIRDDTGWFDAATGTFKPQASGVLLSGWQVWNSNGVYRSAGYGITSKLVGKNSAGTTKLLNGYNQDYAAVGAFGSYASDAISGASMAFAVDAGDTWQIINYIKAAGGNGGQVLADGNIAHSGWYGLFFPS